MKRTLILLSFIAMLASLVALPALPKTNVWTINATEGQNELSQAVQRLRTVYDEEDLIILRDLESFNMLFNNNVIEATYTPMLTFAQPIWGIMETERFAASNYYIHNLEFQESQFSFVLKVIDAYLHTSITVVYHAVEKETDIIRFTNEVNNVNPATVNDSILSYAFPESYSKDVYKVVVQIFSNDGSERVFEQAASSTRVLKPIRVVAEDNASFSIVGESEGSFDYGKLYLISTDFDNEGLVDVTIEKKNEYIATEEWLTTFCDTNVCYMFSGYAEIEIPKGSYEPIYATVMPFSSGYAQFTLNISSGNSNYSIRHYFYSDNVDILLIHEDGFEGTENVFTNILVKTEMTFGLYKPSLDKDKNNFPNTANHQNIIWNAAWVKTDLNIANIADLGFSTLYGNTLIATGQNLAAILNSSTENKDFLNTFLNAGFVNLEDLNVFNIIGQPDSIGENINFTLKNDMSPVTHYSSGAIERLNDAEIMFIDSNGNVRGVYSEVFIGKTALLDFDFACITDDYARLLILRELLTWAGHTVSEFDKTEDSVKPMTVNIYPNPVTSVFNISMVSDRTTKNSPVYSIYNVRGQKVHSGELALGTRGFSSTIDVSRLQLSSGIYFLQVNSGNNVQTKRFLVIN